MANQIMEIYESLRKINNLTTNDDIENYLNLISSDSKAVIDNQMIESLLHKIAEIIDVKNNLTLTSAGCSAINRLVGRPKCILSNCENVLMSLVQLLNHQQNIQEVLNTIDIICTKLVQPFTPEFSNILLDANGILRNFENDEAYKNQLASITRKIVELSSSRGAIISILMSKDTSCEVSLHSLRILRRLIDDPQPKLDNGEVRKILSIVWRYMCFDSSKTRDDAPLELCPSEVMLPYRSSGKSNKLTEKKKLEFRRSFDNLMNNAELPPSGDELWDNSRTVQNCIRHAAICLLITAIEFVDPQIIFTYWPYLIFPGSPSLRHCLRSDSWSVRIVALVALKELLESSQQFLSFAETPRTAITSFTSLSETLGSTLIKLHEDLILLLNNSNVDIVKQALRCLSTLVLTTPYTRVSNSLIVDVMKATKKLVSTIPIQDTTIKFEILVLLQAIFKSNVSSFEIFEDDIDWIFPIIYDTVVPSPENNTPAPIIVKCLQLLSVLGKQCLGLIHNKLDDIRLILNQTLDCELNCSDVCLQSARTVEALSIAFGGDSEGEKTIDIQQQYIFWSDLIPNVVKLMYSIQLNYLRIVGCDCIGSIDAEVFLLLERSKHILIITVLFSCTTDEDAGVRGSAIRALTRGILEAGRKEDPGLLADIAQSTLSLIKDTPLFVRTKAAWALSNLTNALLLNRNELVTEDLDDVLYVDLLKAAIKANSDNDKVKCNIIRALGSLLNLTTKELLNNNEYKSLATQAVLALVKNSTTGRDMKIKWNSCYAIGNMLKNDCIYEFKKDWESMVYTGLLKLVVDCSNFKVRINACSALSSPTKREYYGSFWLPTWTGLIQVLDSCQNIEDFNEYRHRDILIEQVCLTLAHMISVANIEDLVSGYEIIHNNMDIFTHHITKCHEQVVPEKATAFASAIFNLSNTLTSSTNLTQKQKRIIENMENIFKNDKSPLYDIN